jgi:hypothetical protein
MKRVMFQWAVLSAAAAVITVAAASNAGAAGSNMPWEQPLNQILQSVEGPVSRLLSPERAGCECEHSQKSHGPLPHDCRVVTRMS